MSSPVLVAFGLTLLAGLATGIGSAMAFFAKRTNTRFLSVALGFSAGVMIYVSFAEILVSSRTELAEALGARSGAWAATLCFFGGMLVIGLIDKLVPKVENPHEMHRVEELDGTSRKDSKLLRMGMLSAFAIGIHNFPEGLATFVAALDDPKVGISIAVAIALHNIPEGIAVAVPVFYATGSRRKAFTWSFLSGLSEPVGAIIGYSILRPWMTASVRGGLFAAVAGIMVFISLDELLPTAREYGEHHLAIYGLAAGMAVMALSLLLMM